MLNAVRPPLVLALVALLALTACGRSGAPIRPSDAAAKQAKEDNLPAPDKPVPNKSNPGKRFILDGLLE